MNKSNSIGALAAALAKAQGALGPAKKDSMNPHYRSTYADLSSVISAIREPLATNGLSYVQLMTPAEGNQVAIETVLMHESGEWISSMTMIPVSKADAQGYGSAITYAKRYGLQGIVGCPSEDDDGNAAAKAKPKDAKTGKGVISASGSCADDLSDEDRKMVYDSVREAVTIYHETGEVEKVDSFLRQVQGLSNDQLAAVPYFLGQAQTENGKKLSTEWTKYTKAHPTAEELINTP